MLNNIKRLAAFSLALLLCLPLASCSDELSPFKSALRKEPQRCTVTTSLDSALGMLTAEYAAEYKSDLIEVIYEKDSLGKLDESTGEDGIIIRTPGTAVIDKDGSVEGELGALVLSVITRNIRLDNDSIAYTLGAEVLSFTVKSGNCERVLGVDLGYDAEVEIFLSDDALSKITVKYTTASGDAMLEAKYE